jgi:predicted nucleotide-binding protein
MPEMQKRVFISFSHEDKAFAGDLAELMERRGVAVFSDADMSPGTLRSDILRREIERASALVLIIPALGLANRNYALFEAGAAKALGKPVLAVLPPGRSIGSVELPAEIAGLIVLDADRRSLDSIIDTLLQAVPSSNTEAA